MKLNEYPRPPADNGRGVHWSPSQYQWGRKDWLTWQKRILAMGLKWIKVNVPPDYNAEALVKRLVDIEVMPVCRFVGKNPSRISPGIEQSIKRLVKLGARYFETNNEPDADIEWVGFKRPAGWENIVIENLIQDAFRVQALGGIPAFVAFNVGPTESRNPIQILLETQGGRDVIDKGMWISLHNYGKGRPFNYPNDPVRMFGDSITDEEWTNQGQPNAWSQQQVEREVWRNLSRRHIDRLRRGRRDPNVTVMTDITHFRAYEYWNQLLLNEGLNSLPIMMTEGGWETDDGIDAFYPQPTALAASKLNYQMFRFIQGDIDMTIYKPDRSTESTPAPDYLFSLMPWHMGERAFGIDTSGQWEQGAWFTHWHDEKYDLSGELPIIQMLRDLPSRVRVDGPVPPEWRQRQGLIPKNIDEWDYRFSYLGNGIRLTKAPIADQVWSVVEGYWQDYRERHPTHPVTPGYLMVKVLDADGTPIPDARVEIHRGDAADIIQTKGEFDGYLGNYQMTGALGTYSIKVLHEGYPSDQIINVGLGGEEPGSERDQTGFLFVFQLKSKAESTPTPITQPNPNPEPEPAPTPVTPPARPTPEPERPTTTDPIPPQPVPVPTPPAIDVDNDAEYLGVKVLPAPNDAKYSVTRVHRYTPAERMSPNTLFVDVVDAEDNRQHGAVVLVNDASGNTLRVVVEKPANEPGGNTPMWPNNVYQIRRVQINGVEHTVQPVTNLRSEYPDHGGGHSLLVVFKLNALPTATPPSFAPPAPTPQPPTDEADSEKSTPITPAPAPSPTDEPDPVQPPAATPPPIDNNAAYLGVTVSPAPRNVGARVKQVHRFDQREQMAPNTLFVDVIDQQGKRQYGAVVLVEDSNGQTLRVPIEKPANEPGGNTPMWSNNVYQITGVMINWLQVPTQTVANLRSTYPDHGSGHSLLVELQLT